jgi:hypothetical protein
MDLNENLGPFITCIRDKMILAKYKTINVMIFIITIIAPNLAAQVFNNKTLIMNLRDDETFDFNGNSIGY